MSQLKLSFKDNQFSMHLCLFPPLVPQSVDQGQWLIWSLMFTFDVPETVHHRGQKFHKEQMVRATVAGINALTVKAPITFAADDTF